MKKQDLTSAAPTEGEMDLTKAQVENVAAPIQGSVKPQSLDDTVASDEEAADATSKQVPANTKATDAGDAAAPTAGKGKDATADTTESNDAVQGDENTSAEQDSQAQATSSAGPEGLKAEIYEMVKVEDQQLRDKTAAELNQKGVECILVPKYDLQKLLAAAIILIGYEGNRNVDERHVLDLTKALKKTKKNRFSQPIIVCLAKAALMLGAKLVDKKGNKVTLSHPDIDRMFVVLDGQHRLVAVKSSNFKYGADVEIIPCPADIDAYVRDINANNANWGNGDYRNQTIVTTGKEDKLLTKEQLAKKILPNASDKYLAYGLTAVKEAVKKSALLAGKIPAYEEGKALRGIGIFEATRLLNPDCTRNGLLTMTWLTEVFKAKDIFNSGGGGDIDFVKYLKLFMNEERKKGLKMTDKDKVSDFIQGFVKDFKAFVKKNPLTAASDEQLENIDAEIKRIIDAGVTTTRKVFARGSMGDIESKMKEQAEKKAELEQSLATMDETIQKAKEQYKTLKKQLAKFNN